MKPIKREIFPHDHQHQQLREPKKVLMLSPCPAPPSPAAAVLNGGDLDLTEDDGGMRLAVTEIECLLDGYSFRDPTLLHEALTHSSYAADHQCPSYQRLEFVGDAALNLAITNYLFLTNPGLGPGRLSSLRASNISTEKLARVAVRHDLYCFLRRNSPVLDKMVKDFTELVMMETEEDLGGMPYGGDSLKAPKVLADIVESIAAAVYVDCNFDLELLWKVFRGLLEPIITLETVDEQPVTTLYQLCHKHGKSLEFRSWKKDDNLTVTNIFIDGELLGIGSSEQKMISKLNAARDALQKVSSLMEAQWCSEAEEEKNGSKHKLNELCSKKHWPKPIYKVEREDGPSHCKRFICSVEVETSDSTYITLGDQKSRIKDAENAAASKMLSDILVGL